MNADETLIEFGTCGVMQNLPCASEVAMQLDEIQALVLGRVLWNTVVPAKTRANLRKLDRCEFVDQAPARLLAVRDCAIRIEELLGDLQVVAASDEPIGLEQGGKLPTLPVGYALVVGDLGLGQPGDGARPQPPENCKSGLGSARLVVVVGSNTQPPQRLDEG